MVDERREEGKDHCFKCREKGHMAWQCTKRNLYVEAQEAPFGEDEEGNDSGSESGPLNVDDLQGVEEDTSLLSVVRRVLTAIKQEKEDWKRTSIFQTIVRCGTEARMLIIDGGSCMNVVSEATVKRLKLPMEPHPQPIQGSMDK